MTEALREVAENLDLKMSCTQDLKSGRKRRHCLGYDSSMMKGLEESQIPLVGRTKNRVMVTQH